LSRRNQSAPQARSTLSWVRFHSPVSNPSERLRRIASPQNALLKALRRSFHDALPDADGFAAIEGTKIIEEAVRSGLKFRAIVFSHSGAQRADRLLAQLRSNVEAVIVDDEVFRGIVPSESPQGVAALVRFPQHSMEQILSRPNLLVLVVHGLQDPGNLGTLLRSAEAFGAAGLIVTEGTVSRFNAKVVRASAGSIFRLPVATSNFDGAISALRTAAVKLIGTSSHRGMPLHNVDLTGNCAFFLGNEGAGLPSGVLKQVDEIVTIPHTARLESLNAGIAGSVLLYEAFRQRQR
jgi:TrmH family RNA methyltransferase